MKNIEDLIEDDGEVTIGAEGGHPCVATAADAHNIVAMLVRRNG